MNDYTWKCFNGLLQSLSCQMGVVMWGHGVGMSNFFNLLRCPQFCARDNTTVPYCTRTKTTKAIRSTLSPIFPKLDSYAREATSIGKWISLELEKPLQQIEGVERHGFSYGYHTSHWNKLLLLSLAGTTQKNRHRNTMPSRHPLGKKDIVATQSTTFIYHLSLKHYSAIHIR